MNLDVSDKLKEVMRCRIWPIVSTDVFLDLGVKELESLEASVYGELMFMSLWAS